MNWTLLGLVVGGFALFLGGYICGQCDRAQYERRKAEPDEPETEPVDTAWIDRLEQEVLGNE